MNRRISVFALALIAAVMSFVSVSDIASADTPVDGTNVKMVIYAKNGQPAGTFVQTSPGKWVERNSDGEFTFTETGRDQWSVYLVKYGRQGGQPVQLDLHRKTVSTGSYVFYNIIHANR